MIILGRIKTDSMVAKCSFQFKHLLAIHPVETTEASKMSRIENK
jgi:hypothetical protein